jgi:hypothetical protein
MRAADRDIGLRGPAHAYWHQDFDFRNWQPERLFIKIKLHRTEPLVRNHQNFRGDISLPNYRQLERMVP